MLNLFFKFKIFNFSTVKQFKLPDLGESNLEEATVVKWHVKLGDVVEEFQPIADVQTDKMFTQIPSLYNGKVHKIFHKEQDMCQVGELFLEIECDENTSTKAKPQPVQPKEDKPILQNVQKFDSFNQTSIQLSPAARAIFDANKIKIDHLVGTGRRGLIMKQDAIKYVEEQKQKKDIKVFADPIVVVKFSDSQKKHFDVVIESRKIPTLNLHEEYNLTSLMDLKKKFQQLKQPISLTSFLIKMLSLSLKEFPIINSGFQSQSQYNQYKSHNIAIPIEYQGSASMQTIRGVQEQSIFDIQKQIISLKNKVQDEDLNPTISLFNYGRYGPCLVVPYVNPRTVCSLSLGRISTLPDINLIPQKIVNVTWSADHRVLDGATITRISNKLKQYVENPGLALMYLK